MKYFLAVLVSIVFFACNQKAEVVQGNWIKGSEQQKLDAIEKQFRGFDNAMVETGYRYQELYWAGQDENWDYATYQLEKIKIAIENGLERRPNRSSSAEHFLNFALPEMKSAIAYKDTTQFNAGFKTFTINCNSCHAKEQVTFFNVSLPTYRTSPIKK